MSRWPKVGDKVKASSGKIYETESGWRLNQGACAVVTDVDDDGDFQLRSPEGVVSPGWQVRSRFVYCATSRSRKKAPEAPPIPEEPLEIPAETLETLEQCTSRRPSVGDRVTAASGRTFETESGWKLKRGSCATVTEVDRDGDFRLRNSEDVTSPGWQFRAKFRYCDRKAAPNDEDEPVCSAGDGSCADPAGDSESSESSDSLAAGRSEAEPATPAEPAESSDASAAADALEGLAVGVLPLTVGCGTQQLFTDRKVTPDLVDEMKKLGAPSHFFMTVGDQVEMALDAGIRLIDTAQAYGNEDGVGQAVKEAVRAGVLKRKELLVCTKIDIKNLTPEGVVSSFKKTRKDLGVDVVDLLLLHFPPKPEVRKETWRAMEKLKRQGKVRHIGVSNHNQRHLEELLDFAKSPPAVNQIEVHPYNANFDLVEYCHKRGISVMGYSPIGGRGAGGDVKGGVTDELLADPTIKAIANAHKKTPAQVMLRWALQRGVTPIPRGTSRKKMAENLAAMHFELTADDMKNIKRLNRDRFTVNNLDRLP